MEFEIVKATELKHGCVYAIRISNHVGGEMREKMAAALDEYCPGIKFIILCPDMEIVEIASQVAEGSNEYN